MPRRNSRKQFGKRLLENRNKLKRYDLVIVGGGPAGSTLAYHTAARGWKVLVIDKAEFPRHKACGGGLPERTVRLLDFEVEHLYANTVHGVKLSCGPNASVNFFGGTNVHLVHRHEFDQLLLNKAIEKGAEFIGGEKVRTIKEETDFVEIGTGDNTYTAKYLAGCDGARSVVAQSIGFRQNHIGFCIDADVYVPKEVLDAQRDYACLDTNCVPKGYGWVFPKDKFISVGMGTMNKRIKNYKDYFRKFMSRMPEVQGAGKVVYRSGFIPYYVKGRKHWHTDRILLAGDSTGLVDPLSGEGIYYAIRAAREAADVLVSGKPLDEYSGRLRDLFLPDLDIARKMATVYMHTPKIIFRAFMKSKRVGRYMEYFARLMAGEVSYVDLYRRMHAKR